MNLKGGLLARIGIKVWATIVYICKAYFLNVQMCILYFCW